MSEMNEFGYQQPDQARPAVDYSQYLKRTFVQMAAGLGITAVVAWLCYYSLISGGIVYKAIVAVPYISLFLLAAELIVAIVFSARLMKMKASTVTILFYVYAFLTGISFSVLPLAYGIDNMFIAFGFAAGLFACMAVIGYTTKMDLTSLRPLLYAGLFVLIAATVVGIFINLAMLDMIICYVGIIIFMGLTAFDMQKMKQMYIDFAADGETTNKISTFCAMQLYLDFINMFLYILRLLGSRNKN